MKDLPMGPIDKDAPDALQTPSIFNRRYPVKVMYLGVVACLQDKDNFGSRIMLERVSHAKFLTRASKN